MTHPGIRERVPFPNAYKDFHLVRGRGRVYGVPRFLDPDELLKSRLLFTHADVVSASTVEEIKALLDSINPHSIRPEPVEVYEGYNLFRWRGSFYGVPEAFGVLDLGWEEERRRPGVIAGKTAEEVQERIRAARESLPVEFAGWLPIYEASGNCGQHPQFKHTGEPPAGYRFTCSAPPRRCPGSFWRTRIGRVLKGIGQIALRFVLLIRPLFAIVRGSFRVPLRVSFRVFAAMTRLSFTLLRRGARPGPILRFLQSRHYQSQLLLGQSRGLVFLTSMPYTYQQNPWVIEIEDPTTLFFPMIQNGNTCDLRPAESPYFPIVKTLLESNECKAVITHMKSTARMVPTLFGSEKISAKVHYAPLGIKTPERWQRHEEDEPEHLELVFINSWCQVPGNFYVRGGLEVLEAFATLRERYPHLRLTLRTELPPLDDHYHRIIESGWVRVINRFMTVEEMSSLLAGSHLFLLPAARVHILSLLQAMSYGLAVVTSDGWGIEEYVAHERNGLIVKGRYGKTSWADYEAGILREDYDPMNVSDPYVVEGLVEAVSRLVEDHVLRRRLGRTARQDVQTTFTLQRWNAGLKEVFDKVMSPERAQEKDRLTRISPRCYPSFDQCQK